jgi:GNAT superfamily N-acetyltransferase
MPDPLQIVLFTADMLDQVRGFNYGDEPYQQELADWICNDAARALTRGTRIWLYVNRAPAIVGYSSLGLTRWHFPEPTSPKTALLIVPAVAVRQCFWGMPEGPPDERYSSQIMRHLLDEASAWPGRLPGVALFVHPDNRAAIKLYERFAFRPFPHSYLDPVTKVTYPGYLRRLDHV